MGSIGGGINLSKTKTPNDADIRYMPVDNRASIPFHQGDSEKEAKKYLKSIKKHPKREQNLDSIQKVYNKQFDDFDMGSKVQGGEKSFDKNYHILKQAGRDTIFGMLGSPFKQSGKVKDTVVDQGKKSKSSTPPKKSIKKQIGKAAQSILGITNKLSNFDARPSTNNMAGVKFEFGKPDVRDGK
jgi:hypothetical protein